ncbi:MAG: hypothetical protein K0M56_05735 [Kaistella sp.]|nr:hypothetical protein [Kaistella sp.]
MRYLLIFLLLSATVKSQNYHFDYFVEQESRLITDKKHAKNLQSFLINSKETSYRLEIHKSAVDGSYNAVLRDRKRKQIHYFNADIIEKPELKISFEYVESRRNKTVNRSTFKRVEVKNIDENIIDLKVFQSKNSKIPFMHTVFEMVKADRSILFFSPHEMSDAEEKFILAEIQKKLSVHSDFLIKKYTTFVDSTPKNEVLLKFQPLDLDLIVDEIKWIQ